MGRSLKKAMPSKHTSLNDSDLVRPAHITGPSLNRRVIVDNGWCAVVFEGSVFKEVFYPGTLPFRLPIFRQDIRAIAVNLQVLKLQVSQIDTFPILNLDPIRIGLNLEVEFRVSDPEKVARLDQSLVSTLYNFIVEAGRVVVRRMRIDEIQTKGQEIATTIRSQLQQWRLHDRIGIDIRVYLD